VIPKGTPVKWSTNLTGQARGQGFKGSSEMLKNYKDLKVWQKSHELCLERYGITAKFPKEERYTLTSQIRSSVVSIPSNT
jgi:23S rRNA-intervening sequence protein